ncbi:hypothetical protein N7457_007161 [Penicillium paradoxum]|uniref:uncharacterized protein n=1 Tax=Penicillium paradoxum TaxID=176176 RepID=UPI002548904B|nr:uncharacterized protein N7457_007161 [Penicillium paradoxum]KAJ5779441.1 hypothetical protein N7457_007161 [Penicillium paradoxum]
MNTDPETIGITFTDSEERLMEDVQMRNLKTYLAPVSDSSSSSAIVVSNQIDITHETQRSQDIKQPVPKAPDSW